MVRVYIADVSELNIDSALASVTDLRREKALRMPDNDNKRRSLGAALVMYKAVNGGVPFDPDIGANGKPYLKGGEYFSLSHSGKYAVCAVAGCEIGVDVETARPGSLRLAERFFTEAEFREIAAYAEPDELFCEKWVIKESFIKATGAGLKTPLSSFTAAERIGEYSTAHFVRDGYHFAVCVKAAAIGDVEIYAERII